MLSIRRPDGRSRAAMLAVGLACAVGITGLPGDTRAQVPSETPAQAVPAETLIAVAANFSAAMKPLVDRFTARTGHRVTVGIGGTGSLFAQIVNGAPYEILLAADSERPRRLEEDGAAVPGRRFTYAIGRLVLWRPLDPGTAASAPVRDASILTSGTFRHLAVADPTTAPYGRAASQALERLGLSYLPADRIVRGQNVGQAYQFVAGGAAEIGLVALAQVVEEDPATYWILPDDLYDPIEQQAVLLGPGDGNPAAVAFLEFLTSDEARRILADFGYALPER